MWITSVVMTTAYTLKSPEKFFKITTSKEGNGTPLQYSCLENLIDVGMGNTCKPMAVSFQGMTKSTTIKKNK